MSDHSAVSDLTTISNKVRSDHSAVSDDKRRPTSEWLNERAMLSGSVLLLVNDRVSERPKKIYRVTAFVSDRISRRFYWRVTLVVSECGSE